MALLTMCKMNYGCIINMLIFLLPPLGLEFKLPKNGFSEAPQTSQVPRTSLWTNFGEKIFWSYDPLRTPDPSKKGVIFQK